MRRAPSRDNADAGGRGDQQHQPHPRERAMNERQPCGVARERFQRVLGFARDRHLPVVELKLGPVGDDEEGQGQEARDEQAQNHGALVAPARQPPIHRQFQHDRPGKKRGGSLREEGQHHRDAGHHSPPGSSDRSCVRRPSHHDEHRHRRFHERGAVPHDERVVGGEQEAAECCRTAVRHRGESPHQRQNRNEARRHGHGARLPGADAERAKRRRFQGREHRRDEHRIPRVGPPDAPQRLVAGVVHPRAFIVPDDADAGLCRRVGGEPHAPHHTGENQDGGAQGEVASGWRCGHRE